MKCYTVKCPNCELETIIPNLLDSYYEDECFGFVTGDFHCVRCGRKFNVSCTTKIDEITAFKVAE